MCRKENSRPIVQFQKLGKASRVIAMGMGEYQDIDFRNIDMQFCRVFGKFSGSTRVEKDFPPA